MSDTCIVCLGDLGESASDPLAAQPVPRLDLHDGAHPTAKAPVLEDEESSGEIAQLLPCGHILHNVCLKPWVERANSCPICRRSFNMVELSDRPGGMCLIPLVTVAAVLHPWFVMTLLLILLVSRSRHFIVCCPGSSSSRRDRPFDGHRLCRG